MTSVSNKCVSGNGASHGEEERRTQGEESEKAVEDPTSAIVAASNWRRMVGE